MDRKIKFRVYDPKEEKWREDCEIWDDGTIMSSWGKEKYNWIVMLYTGLKDKNGKEIYKNDIVAFPYVTPMGDIGDPKNDYSYYGKVVFRRGKFLIKPIKADSGYWGEHDLYRIIKKAKGYKIGNKFDNPKLLEDDDE